MTTPLEEEKKEREADKKDSHEEKRFKILNPRTNEGDKPLIKDPECGRWDV